MELKDKIQGIIKDIEAVNLEPEVVDGDDEDYQNCMNCLGEAADYLYGLIYYIEKHE